VITKEFLGGKEKAPGAAGLELELSLAELAGGLACAHGAVIYGQLDLAALRIDLAGGAPNDCFNTGCSVVPCTAFWMTRLIFLSTILARSGSSPATGLPTRPGSIPRRQRADQL
jgi:hypothetical protein